MPDDIHDKIERAYRESYIAEALELAELIQKGNGSVPLKGGELATTILDKMMPPYAVWRQQQGGDGIGPKSPAHIALPSPPAPSKPLPQEPPKAELIERGRAIIAAADGREIDDAEFKKLMSALRSLGHDEKPKAFRTFASWFHHLGAEVMGKAAWKAGVSA